MSAIPIPIESPGLGFFVHLYAKETKYEFLKLLRFRLYSLSTIGFPVMFYVLFGVANHHAGAGGVDYAKYLLASYSCFGMIGAALFGVGVGLANERAQGWLALKQASPMPPPAYLLAKALTATAFALVTTAILIVIGVSAGGVHITASEVARLLLVVVAGSVPFASMGLFLAMIVPANAAPAVVNLIYLPMSFCSGLWMPIEMLPGWLQKVAPLLPTYHFAQIALHVFGYARPGSITGHWLALIVFSLALSAASWGIFRRQELRS